MPQQENLTTTTQVDPGVQVFYDRVLLKRAVPYLIHERFAQTRNIQRKSGSIIKFRKYASLSTATTPLTEGVTPPGQRLSKTDISAQVKQYGKKIIAVVKSSLNNLGNLNMGSLSYAW